MRAKGARQCKGRKGRHSIDAHTLSDNTNQHTPSHIVTLRHSDTLDRPPSAHTCLMTYNVDRLFVKTKEVQDAPSLLDVVLGVGAQACVN